MCRLGNLQSCSGMLPVKMLALNPKYDKENRLSDTKSNIVPENRFSPRSIDNNPEQFCKVVESSPERLLLLSFKKMKEGNEQRELGTPPDRLFLDKSKTIKFLKPCNRLGIIPDESLLERSRKLKFSILLMEGGMLPLRKFLERSRFLTLDIAWPIFEGIGPEKKLFLKERSVTFGHRGIEPSKRLNPRSTHTPMS